MGETAWGGNWVLFWWAGPRKSLIQFSVDGGRYVPSLLFDLSLNYGVGNEDNCDLLLKVPCTHCPQPCSSRPTPPPETSGHSRTCLGQSLVGSLLLSPRSWCTQGFVCALQESVSPVLCKFWWFYGGVNGDLLQEGLHHIQVYFTQSCCIKPLIRTET